MSVMTNKTKVSINRIKSMYRRKRFLLLFSLETIIPHVMVGHMCTDCYDWASFFFFKNI